MANVFVKPVQVANAALGLLVPQLGVTNYMWRNSALESGPLGVGDAVTLRLPAYSGSARTRALRSGGPLVMDGLSQRKLSFALTTDVYKGINVTDEELTLDIVDFGREILEPQTDAVAREVTDLAVSTMTGATYQHEFTMDRENPIGALLQARQALNLANVPASERVLAVGAEIESVLLSSDKLLKASDAGDSNALRRAEIGSIYGMNVISEPNLPVDTAILFHRTAFAMATRAPVVPRGAAFGQSVNKEGLALRWLCDYDALNVTDRSIVSTYVGFGVVTDQGTLDADGRFTPAETPNPDGTTGAIFVRAAKITLEELTSP